MTRINIDIDYLSLSHNLRIPLTEILGMTEILNDTSLSPNQKKEVEIIRQAGNRLLEMVDKILSAKCEDSEANEFVQH